MSNRSKQQPIDDQLEAMGRLERRCLLLRLSAANSHEKLRIDLGELERTAGDLDPLVTMRHLHLPVLEERGFIRWDREDHAIARGPRFDELEPVLQLFREIRGDLLKDTCDKDDR